MSIRKWIPVLLGPILWVLLSGFAGRSASPLPVKDGAHAVVDVRPAVSLWGEPSDTAKTLGSESRTRNHLDGLEPAKPKRADGG